MKNHRQRLFLLASSLSLLLSCGNGAASSSSQQSSSSVTASTSLTYAQKANIGQELKGSFNYFEAVTNYDASSAGYGLSQDRLTNSSLSSIAATGFALALYPSFVKLGYISKEEGETRTLGTFNTLLSLQNDTNENYEGCFFHFVNKRTAKHISSSEISTIDTAILLAGVITSMEYFSSNADIVSKGNEIWGNVNFKAYEHKAQNGGYLISMGADSSHALLSADWDMTAEQLMLYIFGAGNPVEEHRLTKSNYLAIKKPTKSYGDYDVRYTWNGSIFTYQYSHAFIDFESYLDPNGIDWWNNSVQASLANYEYCRDNSDSYKSYGDYAWGLTACDTPLGYSGALGGEPRGGGKTDNYAEIEGTIAPTGALGSILFTEEESLSALGYYQSLDKLNDSDYGLRDSYCLDFGSNSIDWYDDDIIGIDKGIGALMLYDYQDEKFSQKLVSENSNIKLGLERLGFTKKEASNG